MLTRIEIVSTRVHVSLLPKQQHIHNHTTSNIAQHAVAGITTRGQNFCSQDGGGCHGYGVHQSLLNEAKGIKLITRTHGLPNASQVCPICIQRDLYYVHIWTISIHHQ